MPLVCASKVHGHRDGVGVETCDSLSGSLGSLGLMGPGSQVVDGWTLTAFFRVQRRSCVSAMEAVDPSCSLCLKGLAACEQFLSDLLQDEQLFRSEQLKPLRGLVTQLATKLWKGKPAKRSPPDGTSSSYGGPASDPSLERGVCEVKPAQFSRLLYTNPVCILSSCDESMRRNLMTISWLTPLDNQGRLICSINKRRHSAAGVLHQQTFVLNIPTANLAPVLLDIGACSGESVDKVERFSDALGGYCLPGWRPLLWPPEHLEFDVPTFAVAGCVAHVVVRVEADLTAASGQEAHHVLACKTLAAFVRPSHWDGKIFCPQGQAQPYLTFFGSQTFGMVVPK